MKISSPAFAEGEPIPALYTCEGSDISPPLQWSGVPAGASSLALVCDDPDAPMGTWVHWVVYHLPPQARGLPEATPCSESLPDGSLQGITDFERVGYGGPCPPPGGAHRYFFKLYALDTRPELPPGATKAQLIKAMDDHILDQCQLIGTFRR